MTTGRTEIMSDKWTPAVGEEILTVYPRPPSRAGTWRFIKIDKHGWYLWRKIAE